MFHWILTSFVVLTVVEGVFFFYFFQRRRREIAAKARFLAQCPAGNLLAALPDRVKALVTCNQRIPAMRELRKTTGLSLKDAKEIIDEACKTTNMR